MTRLAVAVIGGVATFVAVFLVALLLGMFVDNGLPTPGTRTLIALGTIFPGSIVAMFVSCGLLDWGKGRFDD